MKTQNPPSSPLSGSRIDSDALVRLANGACAGAEREALLSCLETDPRALAELRLLMALAPAADQLGQALARQRLPQGARGWRLALPGAALATLLLLAWPQASQHGHGPATVQQHSAGPALAASDDLLSSGSFEASDGLAFSGGFEH